MTDKKPVGCAIDSSKTVFTSAKCSPPALIRGILRNTNETQSNSQMNEQTNLRSVFATTGNCLAEIPFASPGTKGKSPKQRAKARKTKGISPKTKGQKPEKTKGQKPEIHEGEKK